VRQKDQKLEASLCYKEDAVSKENKDNSQYCIDPHALIEMEILNKLAAFYLFWLSFKD
jgi:hypothetical protein